MIFLAISGVLVFTAVGLMVGRFYSERKLFQIQVTETSTAAELAATARSVGSEIGAGAFRQIAELKGRAEAQEPLVSELAGVECVWYQFRITREYEETVYRTDANGNRTTARTRGSETVAENSRSLVFQLVDATDAIAVQLDGASITGVRSHSSFQQEPPASGSWISALLPRTGTRTLGYRKEEHVLPLHQQLYVLGEASDVTGTLCIGKPEDKKHLFLVSVQSEEALINAGKTATLWLGVGAVVSAVAALGFAVAFLLSA